MSSRNTKTQVTPIRANLWGEEIGMVYPSTAGAGVYSFQYAPKWLSSGISPSPMLMPLDKRVYTFQSLNPETYHGLPGMIADAMPDRFGNAVIDAFMKKRGIVPEHITPLQRLAYIGRRAMGAMEFEPADQDAHQQSQYNEPLVMQELVESARAAIRGQIPEIHDTLLEIGSSAGGARAKAVVGYNPETEELVSGQLDLPQGFHHYLLKFDGVEGEAGIYGRREAAYLSMAKAAGIIVPDHFLLEAGDRAHLMVRRFDRTEDGDKLHMQTLCGIAHLDFNMRFTNEYELYLRTINMLSLGAGAVEEGFRRMVFNVAGVNRDDHTKNQSFLMDQQGSWHMAPAYDLGFAHNPNPANWTSHHQMLINGKGDGIHLEDLYAVGSKAGLSKAKMQDVVNDVLAALDDWPTFAAGAGMREDDMRHIQSHQIQAITNIQSGMDDQLLPAGKNITGTVAARP